MARALRSGRSQLRSAGDPGEPPARRALRREARPRLDLRGGSRRGARAGRVDLPVRPRRAAGAGEPASARALLRLAHVAGVPGRRHDAHPPRRQRLRAADPQPRRHGQDGREPRCALRRPRHLRLRRRLAARGVRVPARFLRGARCRHRRVPRHLQGRVDAGSGELCGTDISRPSRAGRPAAAPEAASAHLDRRQQPPRHRARRAARRRVASDRPVAGGDRRQGGAAAGGLRRGGPRSRLR